MTGQVIGMTSTNLGEDHRSICGFSVRIVAVFKGLARPDQDPDDSIRVDDNEHLARVGGLTAHDIVEVQPWLPKEERFSWVTYDVKAVDLACWRAASN